jgi:aspartyl-tRNA(Asn)/glutamyl-tRNA(Gln) amidotransferase subunit A
MTIKNFTLQNIISDLNAKRLSSVEIVDYYLDRINTHNKKLNAYLSVNEDARVEAQAADKARQKNNASLPLLGVPIAIKDNHLTKGLVTTASSNVLKDFLPVIDATVVSKLKNAGAIILGKTNMDAWAHGSSTETSDFGPTKNPWNLNHAPGGSSGGSAAAVAADLAPAAIGTETAGSIRQPAAWCGITGFKPTYGRVSRFGIVSMASSTDSPGPMTKNVYDAGIIMQTIAGPDPRDATTIKTPYTTAIDTIKPEVKKLKIGLPSEYLLAQMDPKVIALIHDAAKVFTSLGAIVEPTHLLDPKYAIGVYTILQRSEVSSNLARFDGIRYGNDRTFFGEEAKRRMLLGTYALSTGYYDQYYKKAQKVRTLIVEDFKTAFKQYDLIIGPVSPGPALKLGASKNQPMFGELEDMLVEASSIAGLTSVSVPCGFVDNLPIGLQITGDQQTESLVLQVGMAYQNATTWHTKYPNLAR